MKNLKDLREAIIRAHKRGKGQREIADFLGISPGTVNKAIKRFEETGSYEDRPGQGPKKTAKSQENVQRALEMLQQDRSPRQTQPGSWLRSWEWQGAIRLYQVLINLYPTALDPTTMVQIHLL
uniref:Homeodomain-like domain-containing protein n=1 Tax=Acrobeloides nanus TaxID=290746 RepID=A0A914CNM9_9BILA